MFIFDTNTLLTHQFSCEPLQIMTEEDRTELRARLEERISEDTRRVFRPQRWLLCLILERPMFLNIEKSMNKTRKWRTGPLLVAPVVIWPNSKPFNTSLGRIMSLSPYYVKNYWVLPKTGRRELSFVNFDQRFRANAINTLFSTIFHRHQGHENKANGFRDPSNPAETRSVE